MIWDRLFNRKAEARSVEMGTLELLASGGRAGVSAERAAGLAVVHRCIQAKAEALAALPLRVYERGADGNRRELPDHPLDQLLGEMMNPGLTAFEGRELLSRWADLHGNSFAVLDLDGRGDVTALHPVPPGAMAVERLASGRLRYRHTRQDGSQAVLMPEEVLHVRHASRDGVQGLSPLQAGGPAVALAVEQQEQALGLARNGATPSGAIVFPSALSPEAAAAVRENFRAQHQGSRNAGRTMLLDSGAEWKPFGQTSRDGEQVERVKQSDLALARLFGVPPSIAGIPDDANYANAVQEQRAFVASCLAPWARRFEAAYNAVLFTDAQRRRLFVEHDLSGLLRGDPEARFAAYKIGREAGVYSANDIRRAENLPPVHGGDTHLEPLNMARMGGGAE